MNLQCPNLSCRMDLVCEDQYAGQAIECPKCKQVFTAPAKAAEPALTGAVVVGGPAPSPAAAAGAVSGLPREAITGVVNGLIMAVAFALLQSLVDFLPGMDVIVGRGTVGLWLRAALAAAILVVLLRLLTPLRIVVNYYIGLTFRVTSTMASDQALQSQVSTAGLYLILILYVGFIYQSVLPPVLASIQILAGLPVNLVKLVKLGFAVAGLILAIKLILAVRPLVGRLSQTISEKAVAITDKVDSKACPACGGRMDRAAKFCPACGKAA